MNRYCPVLIVLLAGCGGAEFSKFGPKPVESAENSIIEGARAAAKAAYQCKEQRLALVDENEAMVRSLITQIKASLPKTGDTLPTVSLKTLAEEYYTRPPDANLAQDMKGILTSEGFKTMLRETAEFIEQIANNNGIMADLMGIHASLGKTPGDKIAEIITLLAEDASKRNRVLGVIKTAQCETASNENIVDALMSLELAIDLGPKAFFLIRSPLKKHAKSLSKANLSIPNSLKKFLELAQGLVPQQDICSVDNLDAYQKYFELAVTLLKVPQNPKEPRPLRVLLNTVMKFHTMENSNDCKGLSYDDITQENFRNSLLSIAKIIN